MRVLDYGTGNGVLAIASSMLAENVSCVGVDLDPIALDVAEANALQNGVCDSISFFENHTEPHATCYDAVVANILARPLKDLAPLLTSRLKTGGRIALAGLLVSQAVELVELYQMHGVALQESKVQDGWALLVGVKT